MFKRLAMLSALAFGSFTVAHATPIVGFFSATGTDNFTSSTVTFDSAQVAGAINGTFATYLTDGNPIAFLPGALPYHNGFNTPPNPPYTTGSAPLFTTTENGVTFTFNLTAYTAGYITTGINGCGLGSTCLDVTGDGFFTATGAITGTSAPGTFVFTSQYVPGQPLDSVTSFSASASAPPVPEPATLALVGSGLLGIVGVARRRCKI
jgi:glycerol uptake facilitator-like aquaporin